VREAAEALDDLAVPDCIAQLLRVEILHQLAAQDLVGERLAVLERQVGEKLLRLRQRLVPAALEDHARRRERLGIRREGPRLAAEHVARKLVEYNDEREAAVRRVGPVSEQACRGVLVKRQEARADLGVEGRALDEPVLGVLDEPEAQNLGGLGVGHHRCHCVVIRRQAPD
jgi:hypothetical protein